MHSSNETVRSGSRATSAAPGIQLFGALELQLNRESSKAPGAKTRRGIRSYVLRSGRITAGQERAFAELLPRFGLQFSDELLDLSLVFGRSAARVLEIGFGDGESLVSQAAANPLLDFVGIEVHPPGIGRCLLRAEAQGINNLRVLCHDVVETLEQHIADESFARVNLYFPDPWPKKRHHKRRLVQHEFLGLLAAKISEGGSCHIATDWQDYAEHIDDVVAAARDFRVAERRVHDGGQPLDRPTTKFERRGLALGHRITEWRLLRFSRVKPK